MAQERLMRFGLQKHKGLTNPRTDNICFCFSSVGSNRTTILFQVTAVSYSRNREECDSCEKRDTVTDSSLFWDSRWKKIWDIQLLLVKKVWRKQAAVNCFLHGLKKESKVLRKKTNTTREKVSSTEEASCQPVQVNAVCFNVHLQMEIKQESYYVP